MNVVYSVGRVAGPEGSFPKQEYSGAGLERRTVMKSKGQLDLRAAPSYAVR